MLLKIAEDTYLHGHVRFVALQDLEFQFYTSTPLLSGLCDVPIILPILWRVKLHL